MVRHIILKRFCAFFIIFCFPFFSITPALCYELSETTSFDTSKNVIVKYEYNNSTGLLSPKYYKVNLENTNYGNGDTTINYGWVQKETLGKIRTRPNPEPSIRQVSIMTVQ